MPAAPSSSRSWLWPPLLLLGCAVASLGWATLASLTGHGHGWMVLVAALEAVWMLSLGGMRAGPRRAALAAAATLAVFLAASILLTALLAGELMGLGLFASLGRISPQLLLDYGRLRTSPADLFLLVLALLLAWRLGR